MFFEILGFCLFILIASVFYSLFKTYRTISKTYELAHSAKHYAGYFEMGNDKNKPFRFLVLGDSIGSGHGVENFESAVGSRMAARLATKYHVTYVNQAGLGKWITDILNDQIEGRWDLIALIVGSNDVLHGVQPKNF